MDDSPIKIDTSTTRTPGSDRSSQRGDPDRGHIEIIIISISIMILESISFYLVPEPQFVRWGLTCGLILGLLAGVEIVRWLTVLLYGGTFLFVIFVSLGHPDPTLISLAVYLVVVVYLLARSRHVAAFFARARHQRKSNRPN